MKEGSFKDLQGRNNENSQNANSWQNNTKTRIEVLRRKYESPSFCKSIKQSELDESGILRDSTNLNESHVIKRQFMKNSQQYSRQSTMKFQNIRQDSRYQSRTYMGEEEIVLHKIKQMKQSLLSDKNKGLLTRLNHEKEKSSQIVKNYEIKNQVDNRADNIDRINSKIRHILNCLNETDKEKDKYQRIDRSVIQNKPKNNQSLTVLRKSCQNTHKYESSLRFKTQIDPSPYTNKEVSKKSENFQKQEKQIQLKAVEKKQTANGMVSQQNLQKREHSQYQNIRKAMNQRSSSRLESARSKSTLGYNFNKRTYEQSLEKDKKNSVKFDEEISKIQQKIKKFEEQKKKLDIQFKPFQYEKPVRMSFDSNKLSSGYRLSEKTKYTDKKTENDKQITPFNRSISSSCFNQDLEKSEGTRKAIDHSHIAEKITNDYKMKTNTQQQNANKEIEDYEMRKAMGEGIQERRKRLISVPNNQKNALLKILINSLTEQVEKDEQLRNGKLWLQNNSDPNKYIRLKDQLGKLNLNMDIIAIKLQFENTQQENNPFFSVRQSRQSYESLARAFLQSKNYWQKNISQRFLQSEIENNNFSANKIDLERKGHIVVEDLVRLLNMETGKFFRNRDLILIFRRFTKSTRMTFNEFLKIITKKPQHI